MSYESFENLEVWKRACHLSVSIYNYFDDCKNCHSLKDQINRASISMASNIAEGAERGSAKDFIRFLHIAKGSAAELRTQLYICDRIGIVTPEKRKGFCEELVSLSKMIHSLIKSLQFKIQNLTPKT